MAESWQARRRLVGFETRRATTRRKDRVMSQCRADEAWLRASAESARTVSPSIGSIRHCSAQLDDQQIANRDIRMVRCQAADDFQDRCP